MRANADLLIAIHSYEAPILLPGYSIGLIVRKAKGSERHSNRNNNGTLRSGDAPAPSLRAFASSKVVGV